MIITNKGLKNFCNQCENDFTFILNDAKRYRCNRFQAYFISPKISKICLLNDASADEYYVQTEDPNEQFAEIMKVMNGDPLSKNCDHNFLLALSKEFENSELVPHLNYRIINKVCNKNNERNGKDGKPRYDIEHEKYEFVQNFKDIENSDYFHFFEKEELSLKNVFSRLKDKMFYGLSYEKEANYISSNFDIIEKDKFLDMNFDDCVISMILESATLKATDEHQLFEFIHEYITRKGDDEKYSYLYSYILFEYLDPSDIYLFLTDVKECYYLNGSLWNSLKQRLLCPINPSSISNGEAVKRHINYSNRKIFYYSVSKPFNGIFNELWQINNFQNPAINGLISITTNGPKAHKSSPVSSIIDQNFSDNEFFGIGHDGKEHEIVFDFKSISVSVSGYTLKAHSSVFSEHNYFLVSWAIMGSHDGRSWEKIDEVMNSTCLRRNLDVKHFECQKSEFFQYIMFRQIGRCSGNYADNSYLLLQEIEFFGETKNT